MVSQRRRRPLAGNLFIKMNQDKTEGLSVTLVLMLFFASGALALVYEVVWARMMMHVFGSTALAQYAYIASTQRNPSERARLMQRAYSLYETTPGQ
jgi:Flp pilus assembly protein TadB